MGFTPVTSNYNPYCDPPYAAYSIDELIALRESYARDTARQITHLETQLRTRTANINARIAQLTTTPHTQQ